MTPPDPRHLLLTLAVVVLCATASAALNLAWARSFLTRRWMALGSGLALWTLISVDPVSADLLSIDAWMPQVYWVRALGLLWTGVALAMIAGRMLWSKSKEMNGPRREFLRAAATTMSMAPMGLAGYGRYIARRDPKVREVDMDILGLHPDLGGCRLALISDLHLSAFVSIEEVRRAVEVANEIRPHLTFVNGDLITGPGDPLDDCIRELSRLRATDGIYGCLGNHEIVTNSEDYTTQQCARAGIRMLRCQNATVRIGSAQINLAGIDYQRRGSPYLVGTHALVRNDSLNLLLSHNPDVFPVASRQGWDLTLAGHTHGGQVTLEYLHPALNPARFYTPFVYGSYGLGKSRMYVTSGVGTVGVPVRLNTLPEVAVLRLRKADGRRMQVSLG